MSGVRLKLNHRIPNENQGGFNYEIIYTFSVRICSNYIIILFHVVKSLDQRKSKRNVCWHSIFVHFYAINIIIPTASNSIICAHIIII